MTRQRENVTFREWWLKKGMVAFPHGQAGFLKLGVRWWVVSFPHMFIHSLIHSFTFYSSKH